jgi:hypothetical protein
MGGYDGFAAAGGNFEAHTGYVGYAIPLGIGVIKVDEAGGHVRRGGDGFKRLNMTCYAALLEKTAEYVQRIALVGF